MSKACKVDGCEKMARAKDLCSKHYTQIKRKGRIYHTRYEQNKFSITAEGTATISLYSMDGAFVGSTVIDVEDLALCQKHRWCAKNENGRLYAVAMRNGKQIRMHRLIMSEPTPKIEVDHKNHNTLDNRKNNLRLVTSQQNKWNMETPSHNSSGYKGVYRAKRKWVAQIKKNRQVQYLGVFETPELAAQAYDKAAHRLFGEYAHINGA